jgi:hypothetical protein
MDLAIVNLVPWPALDGGHLAFMLIEAVRGKPLGERAQGEIFKYGMISLLLLMVVIMFNDVTALFTGKLDSRKAKQEQKLELKDGAKPDSKTGAATDSKDDAATKSDTAGADKTETGTVAAPGAEDAKTNTDATPGGATADPAKSDGKTDASTDSTTPADSKPADAPVTPDAKTDKGAQ